MSIIRVKKRQSPFVVMDKTGLNDPRLSFKAKGLLAYLLSKPDNWTAKITHLKTISRDGRDSVQSGLKELEEYGYLKRERVRDKEGKIIKWESIIREVPGSLPETDFPHVDNPQVGNPQKDNPPLINKELNKQRINKEEERPHTPGQGNQPFTEKTIQLFIEVLQRPPRQYEVDQLQALELDSDTLQKAIKATGNHEGQSFAYLLAVLNDWKENKEPGERLTAEKLHDPEFLESEGWN